MPEISERSLPGGGGAEAVLDADDDLLLVEPTVEDRQRGSSLWGAPRPRGVPVLDAYGNLPYLRKMAQSSATARLEARLPSKVHELLKRAAEIQGRTLTDFVVAAAHEAACRTIAEAEVVRLSIEDQRRLADAIIKPPAPVPALKRAFQRRRALLRDE